MEDYFKIICKGAFCFPTSLLYNTSLKLDLE